MGRNMDLTIPGFVVTHGNPRTVDDRTLEAFFEFQIKIIGERFPDDPPETREAFAHRVRNQAPNSETTMWFVWTANPQMPTSKIVAMTGGLCSTLESNRHILDGWMNVSSEYRRRGFARALLPAIVDMAERNGRSSLILFTWAQVPSSEIWMRRIGATAGLITRIGQLRIADIDHNRLRLWLAKGEALQNEYALIFQEGPHPEDRLAECAQLYSTLYSAMPRDDLDLEDDKFTADTLRAEDASMGAIGTTVWRAFAQECSTRKLVGYTEISWHPSRPQIVDQFGTGVVEAHRSKGIGRWIKAAMVDKVLREQPQAQLIRTGNANSNATMLKINDELGFKPYSAVTIWQMTVEQAKAYLAS